MRAARRQRILDAAHHLFRAEGFRGASMERIAEAAGVSKATLYGYFADKEAVFEGVAAAFADQLRQRFEDALASERTIADRIADALVAKHLAVAEVVRGSSRSLDLFAAKNLIATAIYDELDRTLIAMLAATLRDRCGSEAARMARLLFAASQGIANNADDAAMTEADIRFLVAAVFNAAPGGSGNDR